MAQPAQFIVTQTHTFTPPLSNGTFQFATATIDPPGAIPDVLEEIQEELIDSGVNGRRWRRLYRQYTPFGLLTVSDSTTFAGALAAARNYRQARGSLGSLTITLDGVTYNYRKVKCLSVVSEVRKGYLTGAAASAGSAAIVYGRWQFVLSDVTAQGPV